jgi:hypothetical protein
VQLRGGSPKSELMNCVKHYVIEGCCRRLALSCSTASRCSASAITFSHLSRIDEGIRGLLASTALALSNDALHAGPFKEEMERSR